MAGPFSMGGGVCCGVSAASGKLRPQAPAFFAAEKIGFVSQKDVAAGSYRFCFGDFLRRTPGPPPFSSMNSTPGDYGTI